MTLFSSHPRTFPENLRCNASHGTAFIPDHLRARVALDDRLQRNFSDWGTWELLADVPDSQKIRPAFSRACGDPNRPSDPTDHRAGELFRGHDFGGHEVWKKGQSLSLGEKMECLQKSYIPYHKRIVEAIKSYAGYEGAIVWPDIHCTSNLVLGKDQAHDQMRHDLSMPEFEINGDPDTFDPVFLEQLQEAFIKKFGVKPRLNSVFKEGGFVTRRYQIMTHTREQLQRVLTPEEIAMLPTFHFVQLEVNRDLYMDTRTQNLKRRETDLMGKGIKEIFCDLAREYAV